MLLPSLLRNASIKALSLLLLGGAVLTIGDRCNAMTIEGWKYNPENGQVQFEIEDGVKPRHFLMAQPARIVVDLQSTQIGSAPADTTYTSGPIQRITVEQLQPELTRVTLYMFPSAVFAKGQVAIDRVGDGNRGISDVWTLRPLLNQGTSASLTNSGTNSALNTQANTQTAPLQITTETQTLAQIPNPVARAIAQPPISQISQSIPIAVPAADSATPTIASRFTNIQPATPPTLAEMPPGMADVVKSPTASVPSIPVPSTTISISVPSTIPIAPSKSLELPTKIETIQPETPKFTTPIATPPTLEEMPPGMADVVKSPIANSSTASVSSTIVPTSISIPVPSTTSIVVPTANPETSTIASRFDNIQSATPPKLDEMPPGMADVVKSPIVNSPTASVSSTIVPISIPISVQSPNTTPIVVPSKSFELPSTTPPAPSSLFPPTADTPIITIPQAPIQNSLSSSYPSSNPSVITKAENIVLPESLPTISPTGTQPSTVSVPSLSTIPATVPTAIPTAIPARSISIPPAPMPQPIQKATPNNPFAATPFPLPDQVPQQVAPTQSIQQSGYPPTYQQPSRQLPQQLPQQSQSFPLPDRIPTAAPIQPIAQQQSSNFQINRIAQPNDPNRQFITPPSTQQPGIINFGQPLAGNQSSPSVSQMPLSTQTTTSTTSGSIVALNTNDGHLGLPAGTALMVKYTGISTIQVKGEGHQEMLVLQSAIRDRNGAVLAPEGSTIYGNFVGKENRFVAQSIVLQGQAFALAAESSGLGGNRNPSEGSLLQNSGIGLLAGVLIGGLSGGSAVGGAAAGAIVSYATAPKVATLQPGQTLELKLTQDWILPFTTSVSQAVGG